MGSKVCLITGVGPGTGSELAKRFARADYTVAMLARNKERLEKLQQSIPGTRAYVCDVSNQEQLAVVVTQVKDELGCPDIVIHNAVGGTFGDFMEISPADLEMNFQINTMALLHLGQLCSADMIKRGSGSILCTGNTAAYRGVSGYAGFAPSKAAQRILAESMARRLGPEGIHVAFVAVDAIIDVPWAREMFAEKPDEWFCQPADIAEECFRIAHQPKSAWCFDIIIRPFGESW